MRANHYNVMAVQKIIEGDVSDDSFLYFRCRIILYGRITFENAINNPNSVAERIDTTITDELLLTATDMAFKRKFGDGTDKVLPRDYASGIINYDAAHPIQGTNWLDSDLPKKYSKLWRMYH
jgi:hypothetical protein